jgi:hypothetical protein
MRNLAYAVTYVNPIPGRPMCGGAEAVKLARLHEAAAYRAFEGVASQACPISIGCSRRNTPIAAPTGWLPGAGAPVASSALILHF